MKENQPTAAFYREAIATTRQRLSDYEARGVAALNPYDQILGKTFPGGPDAVLELSRTLLSNQIRFSEQQLAPLESAVTQLALFELKQSDRARRRWDELGRQAAIADAPLEIPGDAEAPALIISAGLPHQDTHQATRPALDACPGR